eukprot:1733743-Rhodomonas_salina.5
MYGPGIGYATCGTGVAFAATTGKRRQYAMCGFAKRKTTAEWKVSSYGFTTRCPVLTFRNRCLLQIHYAVSGTDVQSSMYVLWIHCAVCGTDVAYSAAMLPGRRWRAAGTLQYRATRSKCFVRY